MRSKVEGALSEWRANQKVEVCFRGDRFDANKRRENSGRKTPKRAQRYESPKKRKISLVGVRPLENAGKENR